MNESEVAEQIARLQSREPHIRYDAITRLGIAREVSAISAIAAMLYDRKVTVRDAAATALARIGVPAASALIDALIYDAGNGNVAANALGRIGDSSELPRKILCDARLTCQEQVDLLARLRVAWFNRHGVKVRYKIRGTRVLCERMLRSDHAGARDEAQLVLNWLDGGGVLLRASQKDCSTESDMLLRATSGNSPSGQTDSLLIPVDSRNE